MSPRNPVAAASRRRRSFLVGVAAAVVLPVGISALAFVTNLEGKPGPTALFLIAILVAARLGGLPAGALAALLSFLGLSYFLTAPHHGFHFDRETAFALTAFVVAAVLVATVLNREREAIDSQRTSSSTLGVALRVSGMGAWEWQPDTGRVWLSPEAERLLGRGAAPFAGTIESALALVHPDDRAGALRAVEAIRAGGTSIAIEARIVLEDGSSRWIEVRGNDVGTGSSSDRRLTGVVADVTDRQAKTHARELEIAGLVEQHGLLASVIEEMPVGVVVAEAPSGEILLDNTGDPSAGGTVYERYRPGSVFRPDGTPVDASELPVVRALTRGETVPGETLHIREEDGSLRVLEIRAAPIRGDDGKVVAGVVTFGDVTERDRLSGERHFLAEASAVLYSSLDYRVTLARVASLVVPALADWCAIDLLDGGEIRNVVVHHTDPKRVDLALRLRRNQPDAPGGPIGVAAVLRTGVPQLYASIDEADLLRAEATAEDRDVIGALGLRSVMVVPLVARSATIGVLTLVSAEGGRRYETADLNLAEELARRVGLAVDNARLVAEQADALATAEDARQRVSRLQAVTEALSEAATRADVASVLMREGLVALRAQAGAVFQIAVDGTELERLADSGYPPGLSAEWERIASPATGPAEQALRTGQVVVTRSAGELADEWPALAAAQGEAIDETTVTAPLVVGDAPIGVMHIAYRNPRRFVEDDVGLAETLARQCAQALERARLYEEEQHAREQAERLALRLQRLQTVVDATFAVGTVDELLQRLLTRLRDAVGSDTATILILDEKENVLVTREALGFADTSKSRIPVGQGFAGQIAATQQQLVVPDTSKIGIVGHQLRSSGVVSLAGAPLITEGRTIGVVHVGMRTPREFDREDLLLLRLVAARAAVAIDRAQVHEREHRVAEVLQRSLLPERLPAIEGVEAAARYVPGTAGIAVGGDWYDVFEMSDGSIGVAVGDVVGHGVRAAASMGRLRNVLRAYATEGLGPAQTLQRLNRLACETGTDVFATVVFAILEPRAERLRMAVAGHPPPLLRAPDGAVQILEEGRSLPLGATPDAVYHDAEVGVAPGSTLVLYTDGLVERRGESIDVGIGRLVALVRGATIPVDELADRIVDELENADHTDDVALVAVHLEPVGAPRLSLRFPAEPAALAPLRVTLRSWLEGHGADEDEVFDILVAVNEACSNAVEHPLESASPDVGLDAEVVDGSVSIDIRDRGHWRPPGPPNDRGRGFDFMRALMEDVDVANSPDGTHVRLRRQLRKRV